MDDIRAARIVGTKSPLRMLCMLLGDDDTQYDRITLIKSHACNLCSCTSNTFSPLPFSSIILGRWRIRDETRGGHQTQPKSLINPKPTHKHAPPPSGPGRHIFCTHTWGRSGEEGPGKSFMEYSAVRSDINKQYVRASHTIGFVAKPRGHHLSPKFMIHCSWGSGVAYICTWVYCTQVGRLASDVAAGVVLMMMGFFLFFGGGGLVLPPHIPPPHFPSRGPPLRVYESIAARKRG